MPTRRILALGFALTACAPDEAAFRSRTAQTAPSAAAPVAEATAPASPASPAPRPEALGAFAAYHLLATDVFPGGPSDGNPFLSLSSPTSGSLLWGWGLGGAADGTPLHYLNLFPAPGESLADLLVRAHAPRAILPPGARLLYFGKVWTGSHEAWAWQTVAVTGDPVLDASDVASCTVDDIDYHDSTAGGDVVTRRPELRVRYTPAGEKKLAALGARAGLGVAFGERALSQGWFPGWSNSAWIPSDFPVEGLTDEERRTRATAFVAACGLQGDSTRRDPRTTP